MTFRQVNSSKKQFCSGFFGIFTNYTAAACVNIYNTTPVPFGFVLYRNIPLYCGMARGERLRKRCCSRWLCPCISLWLAGKDSPFIIVNELASVRANCGRPLGAKFTSVRANCA